MDNKRSTNVLLSIIALCLMLIVVKMYGTSLVAEAEAQAPPPGITGCYIAQGVTYCQWRYIQVDSVGKLLTR